MLGDGEAGRPLVPAHLLVHPPPDRLVGLRHQVLADQPGAVGEAVGIRAGRGVEQQPRRLDRIAGDDDVARALEVPGAVAVIMHPGRTPAGPVSIRPTMARSRISAPAASARGIHTVSAERLALVEQPKRQKPRYMQGDDCPAAACGADSVASGVSVQPMPDRLAALGQQLGGLVQLVRAIRIARALADPTGRSAARRCRSAARPVVIVPHLAPAIGQSAP